MALPSIFRRRALVSGAALAALLLPGLAGVLPAAAQDVAVPTTAQAAPEDTVFFASVGLDADSPAWVQAQDVLDRVGVPDALEQSRTAILTDPETAGAITEEELDALLGGEAAIVVLPQAIDNLRGFAEAAIEVSEMAAAATPAMGDEAAIEETLEEAFATPLAGMAEAGVGVGAILEPSDVDAAWAYVERQLEQAATEAGGEVERIDEADTTILVAPIVDEFAMDPAIEGGDETVGGEPTGAEFGGDEDVELDEQEELGGLDEEEIGGFDFEANAAVGANEIAVARAGGFILVAPTVADLESLIDAATDADDSLAEEESFQSIRAEFPADVLLFSYLSYPELREGLGAELVEQIDNLNASWYPGMDFSRYWEASFGLAAWAYEPGFRIDTVVARTDGEPLPPVVPDIAAIDFAEEVPASTLIYSAGWIPESQLGAYAVAIAQLINQSVSGGMGEQPQTFDDVLAMLSPEFQEQQLAEAERVIGINLREDFTDLLPGRFGLAIGAPQFAGAGLGIDAVLVFETAEPEALSESVQRIARMVEGAAGGALSARREGEDTVYVLQDPNQSGVPAFEFGVVGNELLIGTDTGLESYLDPTVQPLADQEQFQTVMGLLPDGRYQEAYVDLGQIIDLALSFSGMGAMGAMQDADPACAEYADQTAAQAALEADPIANAALDLDFDGEACDDFFGAAGTPVATGGPENVRALGFVAWDREGVQGSSILLYIPDDES